MANEEVGKPRSLPPYPEMILRAIAALDEPNGSNKSSISKYIESMYGEVPVGHSALLSHHLGRMKDSGELVFWKNNYTKADPNTPPRRGRGRPPKPKGPGMMSSSPDAGPDSNLARPRGRPLKDPNALPKVKNSSGSGKPRGRPRKMARPAGGLDVGPEEEGQVMMDAGPEEEGQVMMNAGPVVPRGRGRPPKEKEARYNTEVSVQ